MFEEVIMLCNLGKNVVKYPFSTRLNWPFSTQKYPSPTSSPLVKCEKLAIQENRVREKERKRDRQRERKIDRQIDKQMDRYIDRQIEREREREKEREKGGEREREREQRKIEFDGCVL